jgi:ABC-2 type transport system ATP-binding protein
MSDPPAVEASSLSKRYGKTWALRDCSITMPTGRVVALVGPNGAGKTTLLHLATGLLRPSVGTIRVLGSTPGEDVALLRRVSFVGQDVPLYRSFSVREMLTFGERMNPTWDQALAFDRLEGLSIPMSQKVSTLSGGQRAQVGLAVALAKRPDLLLLDEPLASLDPLARRDFLAALMESVAEHSVSVVLSSHLVADLERVCDYLIVLRHGEVAYSGDIANTIRTHRVVIGPRRAPGPIAGIGVAIDRTDTDRQTTALVRVEGPILDPGWDVKDVDLEEIVLGYLSARPGTPGPADVAARRVRGVRSEVGS